MRIYETDSRKPTLSFIDDTNKGALVVCPHCTKEFEVLIETQHCPHCKTDIAFPTWCSW